MAFDSLFLTASLTEAKKQCLNSRILKIQEPDRNTILFRLNTLSNEQVTLFLSAHPQQARFQITKNHFTNPQQPPVFCQILRKYLENGKIIRMEQLPWERIAEITIDSRNEIGDPMRLYLVIEIMGKHSNILLLKKENKQRIILDGIHRYSHALSRYREVLPGKIYLPPPPQQKAYLEEIEQETWQNDLLQYDTNLPVVKALGLQLAGFSPTLTKTIVQNAGLAADIAIDDLGQYECNRLWQELQEIKQAKQENLLKPYFFYQQGELCDYTVWPVKNPSEGEKYRLQSSVLQTLDLFYTAKSEQNSFLAKRGSLLKIVKEKKDKMDKKLSLQRKELQDAKNGESYLEKGQLLTTYRHLLQPGMQSITLESFYEAGKMIEIYLNPQKTIQQNIQFFFHRYNKSKNTEKVLSKQVEQNEKDYFYLEELEDALERAETVIDLQPIHQELVEQELLKSSGKKQKVNKEEQLPPYCYQLADGYTILVGRNHKQNDQLTLKLAAKEDIWLHTKNIPGSHVIIRNPDRQKVPIEIIEQAAAIAAYHSKARQSNQVPVDYTTIKQVKKPAGAKPGMVIYFQNKTIYVKPALPNTND